MDMSTTTSILSCLFCSSDLILIRGLEMLNEFGGQDPICSGVDICLLAHLCGKDEPSSGLEVDQDGSAFTATSPSFNITFFLAIFKHLKMIRVFKMASKTIGPNLNKI